MTWLAQNWIWLLLGVAFVAMHMFGHGNHGGHGGHGSDQGRHRNASDAQAKRAEGAHPAAPPTSSDPHRHQE